MIERPRINQTHDRLRQYLSAPETVFPISHLQLPETTKPPEDKPRAVERIVVFTLRGDTPSHLEEALHVLTERINDHAQVTHTLETTLDKLPTNLQEELTRPIPEPEPTNGTREMLERILQEDPQAPIGIAYGYLIDNGGSASISEVTDTTGVETIDSLLIAGIFEINEEGNFSSPLIPQQPEELHAADK